MECCVYVFFTITHCCICHNGDGFPIQPSFIADTPVNDTVHKTS